MKKIISIAVAAIRVFSMPALAACGGDSGSEDLSGRYAGTWSNI